MKEKYGISLLHYHRPCDCGVTTLLFNFAKTVSWLFNLSSKNRKTVGILTFLVANGLVILHLTRTFALFRIMAFILVLLLLHFYQFFHRLYLQNIQRQYYRQSLAENRLPICILWLTWAWLLQRLYPNSSTLFGEIG